MLRRHIRSIVTAGTLAAALAVVVGGTGFRGVSNDGTNWGQATTAVVVLR